MTVHWQGYSPAPQPETSSAFDPRVRVREALREMIAENPSGWDRPSWFIVRNRLLDRTGSDARPWAELLLEAVRRGWRDRLPGGAAGVAAMPLDAARWNAMVAPFLLQWSAERFIQPEMARWAMESWGYAMRVIDASMLTVAPPVKREPMTALAARLNAKASAGARTVQAAAQAAMPATGSGQRTSRALTPRAGATVSANAGRVAGRSGGMPAPPRPSRSSAASAVRGRHVAPPVPAWVTKAMAGTLAVMALIVVGRVALSSTPVSAEPAPQTQGIETAAGTSGAPNGASSGAVSAPANLPERGPVSNVARAMQMPAPSPEASTQLPIAVPNVAPPAGGWPGAGAMTSEAPPIGTRSTTPVSPGYFAQPISPAALTPLTPGQRINPALTGGVAIVAPEKPGVPSVTREVLPAAADSSRMIFVQPARRASGDARVVTPPPARAVLTYDEMRLTNGTVMRGRVDVVQAGTVLFRDQKSGLRYEIRKDDIDVIITEFGTPVRFRGSATPTVASGANGKNGPKVLGVRDKGVSGRYRIRYAAASAVGSPECAQVWTKPPNHEDLALVTHRAGADTLSVAFEGGDVFPSNIDADGWFASTFRIVPDQARTMTALTTRLNGRFLPNGTLQFAVNIVFYRRMRTGGDVTCNVTVNAEGERR